MFTFLNGLKTTTFLAIIICLSSLLIVQRFKISGLDNKVQVCKAGDIARAVGKQMQEKHLRLREQEAVESHQQSLKRRDFILTDTVEDGCEAAHNYLIEKAAVAFNWHNGMP